MIEKDDYISDVDKAQQKERREKILAPVRRHKHTDEEEPSAENDKHKLREIPRKWHKY